MSTGCEQGYEHDLDSVAWTEHAATCETCARTLALRRNAVHAWKWAKHRDQITEQAARERRLMSCSSLSKTQRHLGAPVVAAMALLGVAVMVQLIVSSRGAGHVDVPLMAQPAVAAAPIERKAQEAGPPASRRNVFRILAIRAGLARGPLGELSAGESLDPGEAVEVVKGAVLRLGFFIDLSSASGEPVSEFEVEGPSKVGLGEEEGRPVLLLREGKAHVTSAVPAVVATDALQARGEHASWTVEVHDDHSHVAIDAGQVSVSRVGATGPQPELFKGQELDVEGAATTAKRSQVSAVTSEDSAWRTAQAALDHGDRAGAESAMRAILLYAHDPALRERVELRLAELLLARGAFEEAEALLTPLVLGANQDLAADAVWLYARSYRTADERAKAWTRYLATSPPAAMRDVALVQRATELLDAGDASGARAIVRELADRRLAPVAADAFRKLESRLPDE